jgi:hypothetical protein
MAPFLRGRGAARALSAAVAVALVLGSCGDSAEEKRAAFCSDARELGPITDPLRNVSAASTPGELEALFDDSLDQFTTLADDAPDEIADDFETLARGIDENRQLFADAGWDAAAVDQADLAELQEEFRPASDAVNAWLQRCDIDTGAAGSSTTG